MRIPGVNPGILMKGPCCMLFRTVLERRKVALWFT
jgi:hypothetical protein